MFSHILNCIILAIIIKTLYFCIGIGSKDLKKEALFKPLLHLVKYRSNILSQ